MNLWTSVDGETGENKSSTCVGAPMEPVCATDALFKLSLASANAAAATARFVGDRPPPAHCDPSESAVPASWRPSVEPPSSGAERSHSATAASVPPPPLLLKSGSGPSGKLSSSSDGARTRSRPSTMDAERWCLRVAAEGRRVALVGEGVAGGEGGPAFVSVPDLR